MVAPVPPPVFGLGPCRLGRPPWGLGLLGASGGGGTQGLRATGTSGWNLGCGNPRAAQMALPKKNHGFRVLTPEFLKAGWVCIGEGGVLSGTTGRDAAGAFHARS